MTGSLERGSHKHGSYQTTHFAVVRRAEFNVWSEYRPFNTNYISSQSKH